MSGDRHVWAVASEALYLLTTREDAPGDLGATESAVTAPYALFVGNEGGDGLIVEGEAVDIIDWVDRVHAYVHGRLDDA